MEINSTKQAEKWNNQVPGQQVDKWILKSRMYSLKFLLWILGEGEENGQQIVEGLVYAP